MMEVENPVGSMDNEQYRQMNGDEKSEYLDDDGKVNNGETKLAYDDNRSNKGEGDDAVESDKSIKSDDSARKEGASVRELVSFFFLK